MTRRSTPRVDVVVGDIADVASLQMEAYVSAANNELWMGSGVAGALKRAAGQQVEDEALRQGPIAVGDAVLTSAGRMPPPARAIIHAAAMGFTERTQVYATQQSVAAATRRALDLCAAHDLRSVALPALGTGVGGLDETACADAMVAAVRDALERPSRLERVRFVVTNAGRGAIFQRAIDRVLGEHVPLL
jgi:O-acetyl-ADP-ribose deacetylase (regulator of RNase III)